MRCHSRGNATFPFRSTECCHRSMLRRGAGAIRAAVRAAVPVTARARCDIQRFVSFSMCRNAELALEPPLCLPRRRCRPTHLAKRPSLGCALTDSPRGNCMTRFCHRTGSWPAPEAVPRNPQSGRWQGDVLLPGHVLCARGQAGRNACSLQESLCPCLRVTSS